MYIDKRGYVLMEIIFRISDQVEDAEMLVSDKQKNYFKAVSIKQLIDSLSSMLGQDANIDYKKDLIVSDNDLIAVSSNCIVTKQHEHKRIVTYAGKAYKINFPNSIYLICHHAGQIKQLEAYCFKEYDGMNTKLYRYAMPNMFSNNTICMGTANKAIDVKKYKDALEEILCTQYTHARPDNIKKFKSTSEYFDYLKDNDFPYNLLYSTGKTLKDVM